jgi:hypothetical protein
MSQMLVGRCNSRIEQEWILQREDICASIPKRTDLSVAQKYFRNWKWRKCYRAFLNKFICERNSLVCCDVAHRVMNRWVTSWVALVKENIYFSEEIFSHTLLRTKCADSEVCTQPPITEREIDTWMCFFFPSCSKRREQRWAVLFRNDASGLREWTGA